MKNEIRMLTDEEVACVSGGGGKSKLIKSFADGVAKWIGYESADAAAEAYGDVVKDYAQNLTVTGYSSGYYGSYGSYGIRVEFR